MRVGISGIIKPNEDAFESVGMYYYFGWTDSNQWASTANGAYFEIVADGSTEGQGRVYCVTEKAGIRTTYDTGIDFNEDEWHILFIGIPSNGGDLYFMIDDFRIYSAPRSTFSDTAQLTCGFGSYFDYTATPLPNHKEWFIDAFSIKYRMNNDRIN